MGGKKRNISRCSVLSRSHSIVEIVFSVLILWFGEQEGDQADYIRTACWCAGGGMMWLQSDENDMLVSVLQVGHRYRLSLPFHAAVKGYWHPRADERHNNPPPMQPGAISGQRQSWKTPGELGVSKSREYDIWSRQLVLGWATGRASGL